MPRGTLTLRFFRASQLFPPRIAVVSHLFNGGCYFLFRLAEFFRPMVCSSVQPEEACNEKHYDHDADDVENIHCVLRLRHARLQYEEHARNQYEETELQSKTPRHVSK